MTVVNKDLSTGSGASIPVGASVGENVGGLEVQRVGTVSATKIQVCNVE